jgi:amino acid transporter
VSDELAAPVSDRGRSRKLSTVFRVLSIAVSVIGLALGVVALGAMAGWLDLTGSALGALVGWFLLAGVLIAGLSWFRPFLRR